MGQVGQIVSQNSFLGGLGSLEGSVLIGFASIIFSLAIAVIPFMAKRIVSGDVGSTAGALIGAAVTAITAGTAAIEGGAVARRQQMPGVQRAPPATRQTLPRQRWRWKGNPAGMGSGNQPVPAQRGNKSRQFFIERRQPTRDGYESQ